MKGNKKIFKSVNSKCMTFMFFFLLSLINAGFSYADSQDKVISYFEQGNKYYRESSYDQAIESYEKVVSLGYENGNLYYNLGNSYFKKGDLGRTLLSYEKARRFIPGDRDLAANYNYAKSLVKLNGRRPGSKLFFLRFFDQLSFDQSTILLSAVYILIIIAFGLSVIFKINRKAITAFVCFCGVIFILSAFSLQQRVRLIGKEAIVLSKNVDVRFEPTHDATRHFSLYQGMKVKVLKTKDMWSKIKRSDNKVGWVESMVMEIF